MSYELGKHNKSNLVGSVIPVGYFIVRLFLVRRKKPLMCSFCVINHQQPVVFCRNQAKHNGLLI
ncbi:hypothetical protein EFM55_10575 [Lactiplantibacillus pentosus]|nr:hypothetical protein [Lactiplantibacillus pentosus]